jgi:hypothetical protein
MACKDKSSCSGILSHILTQVSLGLLPTGNSATLSSTECATDSQRIAGNVG